MPYQDDGADPQDGAETFDETHREDELDTVDVDDDDNPDIAQDVYDVTSALGDADDEDGRLSAMDAADMDPDELDDDLEDDEDEDDDLDDDFEDTPEDDEDEDDDPVDQAAGRAARSEPGLTYVADLDRATDPRDDEAEKYESTRPLSDAQLSALGYLDPEPQQDIYALAPEAGIREERSFGVDEPSSAKGSGAEASDVKDDSDPDEERRLDEGLEETFPASDPVSAKHIT
jgi:hypothetical protein